MEFLKNPQNLKGGNKLSFERIINQGFKGKGEVIKWEVQSIFDEQEVKITFLKKDSPYRQGVWLKTDKGIEVMGQTYASIELWEDTAPKEVYIKCFTSKGVLSFYNIWDKGDGKQSQSYSSGMVLQRKDNELIYGCNDIGFETKFDKLVFSLEMLEKY
ncbi:hypothetical protein FIU87_01225 [Bacillus sp. THAF10]|uniref:hypothetical protein n=1 Tax=Bacillus sp. THAF10 TaxID=2587848 RepID=UPI0012A8B365|nr:hypothetical protein [Bacillus sp. THAF10]QFT87273.1 hypothetical protein FIU87_01225 [Bacillus sp. THAF10]